MVDLGQLGSWLLVFALFIALPFVVARFIYGEPGERLQRIAAWASARASSGSEIGDGLEDDEETRELLRDEKLRSDIYRVQRILATDASKSAVRQIGNRMAYERLLHEWERSQGRRAPLVPVGVSTSEAMISREQRGPESLDICWR